MSEPKARTLLQRSDQLREAAQVLGEEITFSQAWGIAAVLPTQKLFANSIPTPVSPPGLTGLLWVMKLFRLCYRHLRDPK